MDIDISLSLSPSKMEEEVVQERRKTDGGLLVSFVFFCDALTHPPCNVSASILHTYCVPRAGFVSVPCLSAFQQFGKSICGSSSHRNSPRNSAVDSNVSWTQFGGQT